MKKELVIMENPKSSISESIRTIRTNLQFSSVGKKVKSIFITSSVPGEGKSFISSNLALTFAQTGKKTLIIDCDMRRGRTHNVFGLKPTRGLSNLLIDNIEEEFKHYIIKSEIPELYILTRGTVPPNPSELLNSEGMETLLNLLEKIFDYIILDGVPTNGLPDALIMARRVDKVVIVSSIKYTPMDLLVNTKKSLEKVGADIAGVVVNKVPKKSTDYYSSYYE
ncbi:MAG: CpsD/CapB family tyrosine-protein kinase [Bacilli bacterium]|nr:CpsD/CapB family tyrosine-protein kinase [Bacilli bacterium]